MGGIWAEKGTFGPFWGGKHLLLDFKKIRLKIRPKSGIWANKGKFGRYLGGEGQIWAVFGRKRVHLGLFWAENTLFKKIHNIYL